MPTTHNGCVHPGDTASEIKIGNTAAIHGPGALLPPRQMLPGRGGGKCRWDYRFRFTTSCSISSDVVMTRAAAW